MTLFETMSIDISDKIKLSNKCVLDDFKIEECLGSGFIGFVYRCKETKTQDTYAIKRMSLSAVNKHNVTKNIEKEIVVQICLEHENIVKIYKWFSTPTDIYILSEYSPFSDLYTFTNQMTKKLDNETINNYMKQLLSVLVFLKTRRVVHRDIKPENIIVFGDTLKLSDFGWCEIVSTHGVNVNRSDTIIGTLDYVSPEIASYSEHDYRTDLWSVGIILYEMLVGHTPYGNKSLQITLELIKSYSIDVDSHMKNADEFKKMCLNVLKQIFKHQDTRITLEETIKYFN